MAKEIEYKYLVDKNKWELLKKSAPELIVQGFLHNTEDLVIRVRIKGNQGFLTLKGKSVGISRSEFEYEIPLEDAREIINQFTEKHIRKYRYEVLHHDKKWEVDVFEGKLSGLILAELEVASEDEVFMKPDWVTKDVSTDSNYFNAVLIQRC